jgi:hypothetical protein
MIVGGLVIITIVDLPATATIPDGLAIAMTADFRAASIAGRAAQGITDFNEAELHVIIQAVEFERRSAAVDQPGTVSG